MAFLMSISSLQGVFIDNKGTAISTFKPFVGAVKASAMMGYPPFGRILLINGSGKNEDELRKQMIYLGEKVKEKAEEFGGLEVLGPTPCIIYRIKENYRWQIIIKGEFSSKFSKSIKDILYDKANNVYNDIRVSMDINPNSLS